MSDENRPSAVPDPKAELDAASIPVPVPSMAPASGSVPVPASGPVPVPASGGVPALVSTGDVAVDEALAALDGVTRAPLSEQVTAYVGAHRQLQDRLADLDG